MGDEVQLLQRWVGPGPDPSETTIAVARAILLRAIERPVTRRSALAAQHAANQRRARGGIRNPQRVLRRDVQTKVPGLPPKPPQFTAGHLNHLRRRA